MKLSGKIILLAAGTAILSSALTAGVMKEAFSSRDDFSVATADAVLTAIRVDSIQWVSLLLQQLISPRQQKAPSTELSQSKVISLPVSVRRDMEEVSL